MNYDFISVTSVVNEKTEGMLMFMILMGLFLTFFFALKLRWDGARSLGASAFVTTILSIIFLTIGWVQVYVVIIYIALTVASLVMLWAENG